MAITSPLPADDHADDADDLLTLKQLHALVQESGYPASSSTIDRWIDRHGVRKRLVRGKVRVSYTDLLEAQREEAIRKGLNP